MSSDPPHPQDCLHRTSKLQVLVIDYLDEVVLLGFKEQLLYVCGLMAASQKRSFQSHVALAAFSEDCRQIKVLIAAPIITELIDKFTHQGRVIPARISIEHVHSLKGQPRMIEDANCYEVRTAGICWLQAMTGLLSLYIFAGTIQTSCFCSRYILPGCQRLKRQLD